MTNGTSGCLWFISFSMPGMTSLKRKTDPRPSKKACEELPDLILLDVMMPGMDGFEVLEIIRENPATEAIPVVMLTALPPEEGERDGMTLGVTHYITKPWDPETIELTARVVLREWEERNRHNETNSTIWAGSGASRRTSGEQEETDVIKIGDQLATLEQKLGGGLPLGSLTIMEGATSAGTSILGQHLVHGALNDDRRVAYFTSQHTTMSLAKQMGSVGLGISKFLQDERIFIYPLENPSSGDDNQPMLAALALDIERRPSEVESG